MKYTQKRFREIMKEFKQLAVAKAVEYLENNNQSGLDNSSQRIIILDEKVSVKFYVDHEMVYEIEFPISYIGTKEVLTYGVVDVGLDLS